MAEETNQAKQAPGLAEKMAQGRQRGVQIEIDGKEYRFRFDKENYTKARMLMARIDSQEAPHQACTDLLLEAVEPEQARDLGLLLADPDNWSLTLDLFPTVVVEILDQKKVTLGEPKRLS